MGQFVIGWFKFHTSTYTIHFTYTHRRSAGGGGGGTAAQAASIHCTARPNRASDGGHLDGQAAGSKGRKEDRLVSRRSWRQISVKKAATRSTGRPTAAFTNLRERAGTSDQRWRRQRRRRRAPSTSDDANANDCATNANDSDYNGDRIDDGVMQRRDGGKCVCVWVANAIMVCYASPCGRL